MVIDDLTLLDALGNENFEFQNYDELDLSNPDILDELSKVKSIKLSFYKKSDVEGCIKQLRELIKRCPNLESFYMYSLNPNSKDINVNYLIDILIDNNLKQVSILGFNYDYSLLRNKILSSTGETNVTLDKINDVESSLDYIFGDEKLRKRLHFNKWSSEELEVLYRELRSGKLSLENYEKYKDYLGNYSELYITIGNVSEIDLNKLKDIKTDSRIKGIFIKCGYSRSDSARDYTIEEYESIRKVIDNIVGMIKLPKDDDLNRDKLIFAQIYKILGKNIRYDYYAISTEGRKDEKLAGDCRNLKNGLLGVTRDGKKEFLTVCAGYATILQNVCACFNIKCDYISSSSKEVETPGVFIISGQRMYENGTTDPKGHGYNAVYLDGKAYLCDLTWDADNMKLDDLGRHFLKSYEEFYQSHKNEGFSSDNVTVISQDGEASISLNESLFVNSCSIQEQMNLFGMAAKGNIDEMISEGYLADFALKNIEYIKQVKGKVGMLEYLRLIKIIHYLEEYMQSPEFKARAGFFAQAVPNEVTDDRGNVLGKKDFIFYPGSSDLSPDDAINEVTNMEARQWKMK